MAQTNKKRRRKHRGTQTGRIDTSRRSRPRTREEAKAQARSRGSKGAKKPAARFDTPPTWRSATVRGVVAAVLFTVLLILLFKQKAVVALAFGLFMLVFYIPAGYYIDSWMWRRRERAKIRDRSGGR